MLCCVTVRSVWRVDRLAVAFRMASLSGALFSCFFCWKSRMSHRQLTTILFLGCTEQKTMKQNAFKKLSQPTFSSEPTSTIFGRVGGGLFFMSSKTSTTNMKHWQVMEESVSDCHNLKRCQILRCIPLSLRFSSATVLVSVRTLSVAACMSLWWVRVLGSSRLPCTY